MYKRLKSIVKGILALCLEILAALVGFTLQGLILLGMVIGAVYFGLEVAIEKLYEDDDQIQ